MQSAGRDVLRIAHSDVKCVRGDGSLRLESSSREKTKLWRVAGAHTTNDGVAQIRATIVDDFKDFAATSSEPFVASSVRGTRVHGTGVESDDNDPEFADVIVFEVGGRIFVACTHGETILKSDQEWMVKVVQAAKAP